MDADRAIFGRELKRYRVAAGLTQEALAERAGLSVRGISDLERGRRTSPYLETVRRLADALGLAEEDRSRLIAASRSARYRDEPPATSAAAQLPAPPTSWVGRNEDVVALRSWLERTESRLITLTGPGGVGKTRLALHVASETAKNYAGDVVFVPLAALRDPSLLLDTIGHHLGLAEIAGKPALDRLINHIGTKQILLVLDNLEHLLPSTGALNELLAGCPGLTILATSRRATNLSSEKEYPVAPLSLPDTGESLDQDSLRSNPSVTLLLDRLASVVPRAELDAVPMMDVVEICLRTDGLPLAIELAAARARHLTVHELSLRLGRRLDLLSHGSRDLPERQQRLRDTIAWSDALLAPSARRLFGWLSVFDGGWTLEQAEALCAGQSDERFDVLESLSELVDSNLVQMQPGADNRTRYSMLETIRQYARQRLAASGDEEMVLQRHAVTMRDFSTRLERGLTSGERPAWARVSREELENIRGALRWMVDHGQVDDALLTVGNLHWFWDAVGRYAEGWAWCEAALARASQGRNDVARGRALCAAGVLAWNAGEFVTARERLCESVACLRQTADRRSLAQALALLAMPLLSVGDPETAERSARESVDLLREPADPWNAGVAYFILGETLAPADLEAARSAYQQSLRLFRSVAEPWGTAMAIHALGGVAMRQHDYSTARELMHEALELRRPLNNPHAIATSLTSLGELARRMGDDARACTLISEGLAKFRDVGDQEHIAWALYNLGMFAMSHDDVETAATSFTECLTLRAAQGNVAQIVRALAGLAWVALKRKDLNRAVCLWGGVEAARERASLLVLDDEDADQEARTRSSIVAALGETRALNAFVQAHALSLDEVIELGLGLDRKPSTGMGSFGMSG